MALTIESTVLRAYGDQIRAVVLRTLASAGLAGRLADVVVKVRDRGALDFVLEARVKTALARALSGGGPR
jgi:citrate lyase subunit gamma (acyl carrier protein)